EPPLRQTTRWCISGIGACSASVLARTGSAGTLGTRPPLEAHGARRKLGRSADRADRPLEQLGLSLYDLRGVLQRSAGGFERLGLAAQHHATLLEQVEQRIERRQQLSGELLLEPALALDQLLDQFELALHLLGELPWNRGGAA